MSKSKKELLKAMDALNKKKKEEQIKGKRA